MSTTDTTTDSIVSTDSEVPDLNSIGVELEYPIANDNDPAPAGTASGSGNLYSAYDNWDVPSLNGSKSGRMTHDHVGAEITSGVLDIHSTEPETWYEESVQEAEDAGYPFAATGYGDTIFGLHQHVSQLNDADMETIATACGSEWARVFWCTSIQYESLDPWRHGGVGNPGRPFRGPRHRGEDNHYEFRLPEPCLVDHFGLMVEFWRKVGAESAEAAVDFARGRVYDRDQRLTAVQQYNQLDNEYSEWPHDGAFEDGTRTDQAAAEWFHDLMN